MMDINFEILDTVLESMAILNKSGEIIFTNRAWREFSAKNMGDDSCTGLKSNYFLVCDRSEGDDSALATQAKIGIQRVMNKQQKIFELEYPCHSLTEKRWFILRASRVSLNPELTLVTHINITNRKIAELKVENNYNKSLYVNNRLESTLHKIVHDIQNPLLGIMKFTEFTKSENDIENIKKYIEIIHEGTADLRLFIKSTLKHLSKSNQMEPLNVDEIITEYIKSIEQLLKSNSIEVRFNTDQSGQFISNAIEFRSILSNLVDNSIKYKDKEKIKNFISINFSSDDSLATLKIKDNGIGIKKEDLAKIMNLNYQVNEMESEGVGIGLYMVKKSVALLDGKIKVNSHFGIGTEFIIELPRVPNKT